ncbi:MAG: DNA N-6-adenine-methyltransferase [Pseudomonadota bacterium]
MSGPNSAPEIGQQNYRTPKGFLAACQRRFDLPGGFDWDLACTEQDCVGTAGGYWFPEMDALAQDWSALALPGITAWVNPPFAQAGAFCGKAAASSARVLALVPVAIGTRWWQQHVHRKAVVAGVGRLVFDMPDGTPVLSKDGKPQSINRDCALLAYNVLPIGTDWYLLENWRNW